MKSVLLHNPGLSISLALLLAGLLISALMGVLMARSGVSPKGIAFFAVFFAIVVLPQVAGHLALAVKPTAAGAPAGLQARTVDLARAAAGLPAFQLAVAGEAVRDAAQVFGADHAQGRRSDARALFASRMPGLEVADAVHWPTGESVTALVFGSADEALAGMLGYLSMYRVAPTLDRGGVEVHGVRGLGGGLVQLRRSGAALLVVTALSEPGLAARVASLPLLQAASVAGGSGPLPTAGEPLLPALQPLVRLFRGSVVLQIAGVLAMVALAAWWFFAGSAWAARVPAEDGAVPLPAAALKARLLAVNQAEVPMQVDALPDGRVAVTWRYADARFVDFSHAHRMVRTHRLLLRIDEAARRVSVTEQSTELDARAGLGGASLRWRTALGIGFFQVDHRRVFGLQFGPDGRPTGDLSYAWRFNLNELKAPFIAAVTAAGWSWQPVALDLPALLERQAPAPAR